MKFVSMDLLQMSFPDESFTCFLDKGTLDALMSGTDTDSKDRAIKLFKVLNWYKYIFKMSVLSSIFHSILGDRQSFKSWWEIYLYFFTSVTHP